MSAQWRCPASHTTHPTDVPHHTPFARQQAALGIFLSSGYYSQHHCKFQESGFEHKSKLQIWYSNRIMYVYVRQRENEVRLKTKWQTACCPNIQTTNWPSILDWFTQRRGRCLPESSQLFPPLRQMCTLGKCLRPNSVRTTTQVSPFPNLSEVFPFRCCCCWRQRAPLKLAHTLHKPQDLRSRSPLLLAPLLPF